MSCYWRGIQILKDYKKLKKEIADDFIQTIKEFRKRHPYVKNIIFDSKYNPWMSHGIIYLNDKFDISVYEDDVYIKE